jgi:hypothetical protein
MGKQLSRTPLSFALFSDFDGKTVSSANAEHGRAGLRDSDEFSSKVRRRKDVDRAELSGFRAAG